VRFLCADGDGGNVRSLSLAMRFLCGFVVFPFLLFIVVVATIRFYPPN